ncbi:MAG: nucleotidyltransferase domain-containing protein [Ignavibacteriaceae bacterium]
MKDNINTLLTELRNELEKLFADNLVKIFLYGSYARKEAANESDLDIIVLVKEHSFEEYNEEITKISVEFSLKYDLVISIIIDDYKHFQKYSSILPFYMNVVNEGIELYGR